MKATKRLIGILLAAAMMATTLAGCGDKPSTQSSGSSTASGTEDSSTPANTEGREYVNGTIDVTGMPKIELKDKKVSVYCWGEYIPETKKDWQGFRFRDYYGGEVETILSSGDYYETLFKLIAGGEIPDAVVAETASFPSFIMRDMVQPWGEYLHYDDPAWEQTGAKADIEKMKWDDKIFNVTNRFHSLGVMFYNEKIIADAGLEAPIELQKRGEWNWDAFKKYLEETTTDNDGDGVVDVYGMVNTGDFPISLFCSTGETHIEFNGKSFVNNIKSAKVQDAANFLYSIGNNGDKLMLIGDPVSDFLAGKAAFVFTNDYRGYVDYKDLWASDGLGVVPMPKYDGADQQYQAALPDFLWLMKGAKNPEGAGLMALAGQYDRLLNNDPTVKDGAVQDFVSNSFTQEAAEMAVSIWEMPMKPIWSRCVRLPDGNLEYRAMDEPWMTLADSANGGVDKAIQDTMTPYDEAAASE